MAVDDRVFDVPRIDPIEPGRKDLDDREALLAGHVDEIREESVVDMAAPAPHEADEGPLALAAPGGDGTQRGERRAPTRWIRKAPKPGTS